MRPDGCACCGVRCSGRRQRRRRRAVRSGWDRTRGAGLGASAGRRARAIRHGHGGATATRSRGARQVARGPTGAKRSWWASAQIKRRALATATVQYKHKKIPRGHFFYPMQPPPRRPCVGAPASAMSVAPSGSATKERATGRQLPSTCPSAPPSPDSPKSAGWQLEPPGAWAANFASAYTSTGS